MSKPDDSQRSHLTICQMLGIEIDTDAARAGAHPEDEPLIEGMLDFLDLRPGKDGREKGVARRMPSAPSRLVQAVIQKCMDGGMTKNELPQAMGWEADPKNAKQTTWQRFMRPYEADDKQMDMNVLEALIVNATAKKWIDKKPAVDMPPHPKDLGWGDPRMEESARAWEPFNEPADSWTFYQRMDAISGCIELSKRREEITLAALQVVMIELDLVKINEKENRRPKGEGPTRRHSQLVSWSKARHGDNFWIDYV
ncbi:MAG: hypothetical protein P4L96_09455 [Rhodoferax sp.]|nr:hypothetical protein [Rhodoferax sp.]